MAKLLIVYHTHTGNTTAMAEAVYGGASSTGATVTMKRAADARAEDILDSDAVCFGTPDNFSYMSGIMKDFFDRVWIAIRDSAAGKPYTAFCSSGSGGKQALDSIDAVCEGLEFKKVVEGILAKGKPSTDVLEQCKELGKKLAQL